MSTPESAPNILEQLIAAGTEISIIPRCMTWESGTVVVTLSTNVTVKLRTRGGVELVGEGKDLLDAIHNAHDRGKRLLDVLAGTA